MIWSTFVVCYCIIPLPVYRQNYFSDPNYTFGSGKYRYLEKYSYSSFKDASYHWKKKIIFNICKISICFFSKCQVGYGIKSRIRPVPNPHYRFSEPCYVVCTAPQAVGLRPSPPNPRRVQKTGRKSRGESVLSQAEATKSGQPSQGTPRQEKGCGEEAGPQQERPHR